MLQIILNISIMNGIIKSFIQLVNQIYHKYIHILKYFIDYQPSH